MSKDPMAEIRATFFAECEELMEALTDGLTTLADGEAGKDTVNAVFRAVHSIKGGAGAFGYESLVRFAHKFETAMDEVRSGRIAADQAKVAIFFRSADHLADLISHARGGAEPDSAVEEQLLEELESLAEGAVEEDSGPIEFQPIAFSLDDFGGEAEEAGPTPYKISFVPYPDLFSSGNDPLFILQALAEMGEVTVTCDLSGLPVLEQLDPQTCHLAWTIELKSLQGPDEIREAASFVEGLCSFEVSEPSSGAPLELEPLPDFGAPPLAEASPAVLPEHVPAKAAAGAPVEPKAPRASEGAAERDRGCEGQGDGKRAAPHRARRPRQDRPVGEPGWGVGHQPIHAEPGDFRGRPGQELLDCRRVGRIPPPVAQHPGKRDDDPRPADQAAVFPHGQDRAGNQQ